MNASLQTFIALSLVVAAASWLVARALVKKKNPGCGGDCGCPTDELKAKLKR
jgi:hypothetical protein